MAKNVAPVIEEIDITPANYRFPPPTAPVTPASATINSFRRLDSAGSAPGVFRSTASSSSQSMQYAKGIRWEFAGRSSDPNGDRLIYKVEIRGVQEREWKLLRDKLKEKFLSWDSNSFRPMATISSV